MYNLCMNRASLDWESLDRVLRTSTTQVLCLRGEHEQQLKDMRFIQ